MARRARERNRRRPSQGDSLARNNLAITTPQERIAEMLKTPNPSPSHHLINAANLR
jgi:hypothetical protein